MKLTHKAIAHVPRYIIEESSASIHFVSNELEWKDCAKSLLSASYIGIDTETKPAFKKNEENRCCLIQIAVRDTTKAKDEIFVIDLFQLSSRIYDCTFQQVFLSSDIIKLGQGLDQDLKHLAKSYPEAICFQKMKQAIEVNDLSILSLQKRHPYLSLQKLALYHLRKRLVKTNQLSNWERRPLADMQLQYAAADALILLHLYDKMTDDISTAMQNVACSSVDREYLGPILRELIAKQSDLKTIKSLRSEVANPNLKRFHQMKDSFALHRFQMCSTCGDAYFCSTVARMEDHCSTCKDAYFSSTATKMEDHCSRRESRSRIVADKDRFRRRKNRIQRRNAIPKVCVRDAAPYKLPKRLRKHINLMAEDEIWNEMAMSVTCNLKRLE